MEKVSNQHAEPHSLQVLQILQVLQVLHVLHVLKISQVYWEKKQF